MRGASGDGRQSRRQRRETRLPGRRGARRTIGRLATGLIALVCAGVALATLTKPTGAAVSGPPIQSSPTPTAVPPGSSPYSSAEVALGSRLFVSSCAVCHGMNAAGIPSKGPSLQGVGALAADFYLQTGRMPLPSPRAQPQRTRPAFPRREIRALVAYVASFGGPPIPVTHPRGASVSRGQQVFAEFCAGCHTIQGQGGIVTGAVVPSLNQSTPAQIAEAVRIGPYVMPRFSEKEIDSADLNAIVRYVQATHHPADRGGWGIGRIGPIPEGMVAWLLAIAALLLIARLIGERKESEL